MIGERNLPSRAQLHAVMLAAMAQGDVQGMHAALALLAIVAPDDADAILAVIEARAVSS